MSLRETQALFHRLVTAPENVEQTLATLGIPQAQVSSAFKGDEKLSATARLDVYADMYFFRIRDVLMEAFERVVAEIGEERFHNLAVDYLITCPPHTPSIRDAGDRLADFIGTHEIASEFPWLSDLARLEWLRLDVFDEADAPLLDMEALRATPPEEFASVALSLVPAHRFFGTEWSVEQDDPKQPAAGTILVWRNGFDADHRRLSDIESAALRLVAKGTTFGDVCELIASHVSEEEAPKLAFELLARWVGDELLAASEQL